MDSKSFVACFLAAVPILCSAQSKIAIYGIVDTGVAYVTNQGGKHVWKAQAGNLNGDRWGMLGSEDLGGGLKAIFRLESGFNVNTGTLSQGGREFGRQAYVGLSDDRYGALTFGRQYESVLEYVGPLSASAQWASIVGAHMGDIDDLAPAFRVNNSVKYTSADFRGLKVGVQYGFSNQAGAFSTNREWSTGARYASGPLTLGIGYFRLDDPAAAGTAGAVGASSGATSDYGEDAGLASLGGKGTIKRHEVFAIGGAYRIGSVSAAVLFSRTQFNASIESASASNYELNVSYRCIPTLLLGAAYIYTDGRNDGGGHPRYHQINLGADYALSKRTDLYLLGLYQRAASDAVYARLYTLGASGSNGQATVIAGIRHRF